ncbi:nucleolar transcription factor 1-like isoform 2-T2 [Anableps anableps]
MSKNESTSQRSFGFEMSGSIMEDDDSGAKTTRWTQKNLQKLLASLKDTIPENQKTQNYIRGLKAVDWDKVAFPPFSAEECQEKWNSMMVKMRRYRSLSELLDEAEDVISDPFRHKNIHPELPKQSVGPKRAYIVKKVSRYMKKHPGMPIGQSTTTFSRKYDKLPVEKKAKYSRKYTHEFDEYSRKMQSFCINKNLPLPRKSSSKRRSPEDGDEGCSKDNGLPKKPPQHGRALFFKEYNKEEGSSFGASFFKIMGQRWKELSTKEKQGYNTRCEKMKREYEAKLIEYLDVRRRSSGSSRKMESKCQRRLWTDMRDNQVSRRCPREKPEMTCPAISL